MKFEKACAIYDARGIAILKVVSSESSGLRIVSIFSSCAMMVFAHSRKAIPFSVGSTPFEMRLKMGEPNSVSTSFIALLRFGCPIKRLEAAFVIEPVFSTSTRYFRCIRFIFLHSFPNIFTKVIFLFRSQVHTNYIYHIIAFSKVKLIKKK